MGCSNAKAAKAAKAGKQNNPTLLNTSAAENPAKVEAGANANDKDAAMSLLKSLFSSIDADSDGKLDAKELAKALSAESSLEQLLEKAGFNSHFYVLEQLDSNQDGKVSWDEFKTCLEQAAVEAPEKVGEVSAMQVKQNALETLEEVKLPDETVEAPKNAKPCSIFGMCS